MAEYFEFSTEFVVVENIITGEPLACWNVLNQDGFTCANRLSLHFITQFRIAVFDAPHGVNRIVDG